MKLPNGNILTTVAGVINHTYTGVGGRITYYVPKNTALVSIEDSGVSGTLTYNGVGDIDITYCPNLDGLISNKSHLVAISNSTNAYNLIAKKAIAISGNACALTAKSIGDILYAAYVDNRANVNFNFIGGTNAGYGAVGAYTSATYGKTSFELINLLVTVNGGTIQINV